MHRYQQKYDFFEFLKMLNHALYFFIIYANMIFFRDLVICTQIKTYFFVFSLNKRILIFCNFLKIMKKRRYI
jgi:hypothetical protein